MKTIVVTNQKGGVGKTTTAWALANKLSDKGNKVLAVDMDSQINLTLITQDVNLADKTIYDVLTNPEETSGFIQKLPDYDMLIGSQYLANLENQLNSEPGREFRLREALETVEKDYDYCIIDTSPSLSVMSLNAMAAADYVIIPALADYLSFTSINTLYQTYKTVKKYINPGLKISGIVLTRYNPRTKISQAMLQELIQKAQELNSKIYESKVRESVVIKEAQLLKKSLFDYKPKAMITQDYSDFVEEVLEDLNE